MKTSLRIIAVSLVLLGAFFLLVRDDERYGFRGRTVVMPFYSQMVNDRFKVAIYLPGGYDENNPKRYPVIYQLDGSYYGRTTAILAAHYYYTKEIPTEAIVVSIGYYYDGNVDKRERDFLYVGAMNTGAVAERPAAGGGMKFYLFLKNELIPYVDSHFRTDNTSFGRTLAGHCYGGYFVVFALFDQFKYTYSRSEPGKTIPVFSNFIAASPVIVDELSYLLYMEQRMSSLYSGPFPVRLFIAASENEDPSPVKPFPILTEKFSNWKYPGFRFKSLVLRNMFITQTAVPAFKEGLKFVFIRPAD